MARRKRSAGSQSAGYHYDATPKHPAPTRTPVKAPKKSQAARGPAGDYKGANRDYAAAVATLPGPARTVTEAATVAATKRQARAEGATRRAAAAAARAERRRQAAALASVERRQARRQRLRESRNPAKAIIGSKPNPLAKPPKFAGKPTAGEPTRAELQKAKQQGNLTVNKKGFVLTPMVEGTSRYLHQLEAKAAEHGPDLSGLSPEEREVVQFARRAHRKHPNYPIPVALAQVKQESGFDAGAVSSAGAEGLTQFIPSTAASYGVKYGTGKPEKRSQVMGQFALMEDNLKQYGSVTAALNAYLGLAGQTSPSDYSSNILAMAKEYRGLGKPALPKELRKNLRAARAQAKSLGLKVPGSEGRGTKGIVGHPSKQVVTHFKAIKKLAKGIEKLDVPYVYGGGHNGGMPDPREGLDCSSSTVYLLRKAGYDVPNITSGEFGNYFPAGPGAVTIFYNSTHVFLRIGNEYWGTSAGDSGSGGLGKHPAPSAAYLAQYNVAHVPGLGKKQALQLGFKNLLGGGGALNTGAFPGMTLSPDGSTATVAPGQGAKQGKAGFSKRPIVLSPLQKYNRTKRKLHALGVGEAKGEGGSAAHPILEELIQKYGSAEPNPTAAKERRQRQALAAAAK
ncbi:MAG TPA: transglycosylase SLT domain-containing protein [Solirubrobacterales bacterium]